MRTEFVCERTTGERTIALQTQGGEAQAVLEPPGLVAGGATLHGRWDAVHQTVHQTEDFLRAEGRLPHGGGVIYFVLEASMPAGDMEPVTLHWLLRFEGKCEGAITHPVMLPGASASPDDLDLPSVHYGGTTYGTGLFPHPDPRKGFAVRADRMARTRVEAGVPSCSECCARPRTAACD